MARSVEQVWELSSGKCIRKYSPEHPLFDAGTRLWATKYYNEPNSIVQTEEVVEAAASANPISCRLENCNLNFQSIAAYEEHYDMVHRNICRECFKSFLSLRLLDIHISETHDAFFKILSKKKPMYICLVDGCPEIYRHDEKRLKHLIKVHQYPDSFSFHQQRKQKGKSSKGTPNGPHRETDELMEVDVKTMKKREARKRTRQKKKKQVEQTKRLETGMEVDAESKMHDDEEISAEVLDVDMAGLEESMRALRIPKSIYFGRKRRV